MKDFLILRFLDLFKWIFLKAGYDYESIRLILRMKFILGSRKPMRAFGAFRQSKETNSLLPTLGFHLVIGLMFGLQIAVISQKTPFLSLILFFTINMVFVLLSLFGEFSASFLDLKDAELLLPTPIKPETLSIAKNLYIFLFFLQIELALSLPGLIYYGYFFGIISALIIFVTLILCLFFMIALISILYGLLLRIFSGEKLKDSINYLQIVAIVVIFVFYLVFANSLNMHLVKMNAFSHSPILYLIPPAWFAALGTIALTHSFSPFLLKLSLLGILFSGLGYFLYLKMIAPFFETNLFKVRKIEKRKFRKKRTSFLGKIFSRFKFGIFFDFSSKMLSSDRKLKLAIYPSLAMAVVFPVLFPFIFSHDNKVSFSQTKYYYFLYFVIHFSLQIFQIIYHSEYFKAAWVFKYLPLETPRNLFKGSMLSLFLKFQLPLFLFVSLIYLWIWGIELIPDIIVTLLNGIIVIQIFLLMSERIVPFSQEIKGGRALSMRGSAYLLSTFVFLPLTIGVHYIFSWFASGKFILMIIQGVLIVILWKNYFEKLTWNEVKFD